MKSSSAEASGMGRFAGLVMCVVALIIWGAVKLNHYLSMMGLGASRSR